MAVMPEELRLAENQILNEGFIYEVVEAPMGFPLAFWPRVVFKERHPRGTDTAVRLEALVQELRDGRFTARES